ncbi:hypothetical protein ACU686_23435 [Yinghuangia aomiensis]
MGAVADADAARARGLAEAEAAEGARGCWQAEAAKAQGLAEAEAISCARGAGGESREAVIAQCWRRTGRTSSGRGSCSATSAYMVLLNGADGMADMFAKALTLGGSPAWASPGRCSAAMNTDGTAVNGTAAQRRRRPRARLPSTASRKPRRSRARRRRAGRAEHRPHVICR